MIAILLDIHTTHALSPDGYQRHLINFCEIPRHHHHHCPLIPLSGVGTTYFLLPFFSITCHLHADSFYSHDILHITDHSCKSIHLFFLLGCPSTFIVISLSFRYVTFISPHNMPIPRQLIRYLLLISQSLPKLV
jgi:hypothetical protein